MFVQQDNYISDVKLHIMQIEIETIVNLFRYLWNLVGWSSASRRIIIERNLLHNYNGAIKMKESPARRKKAGRRFMLRAFMSAGTQPRPFRTLKPHSRARSTRRAAEIKDFLCS